MEIVDGMQRLNAIISFILGEYGINYQGKICYFNPSSYNETFQLMMDKDMRLKVHEKACYLPRDLCLDFTRYQLPTIITGKNNETVDMIFSRINSTGRKISNQDLRQSMAVGEFPDLVRRIASDIRMDNTYDDHIRLCEIPQISVGHKEYGYGVDLNDIFWRRHDLINAQNVKESKDEEIIETLLATVLLDQFKKSKSSLDELYRKNSKLNIEIEGRIREIGKNNLEEKFKKVFDIFDMIFVSVNSDFSSYLFEKKRTKNKDEGFKVVFLALYNLISDGYIIVNYTQVAQKIKNAVSIIEGFTKAVQDAMFKEIDARKKALKKKKEYYDYDKTIKKKTDEIELIKQQIRGLEGLTDAESKAQKARLEASLKDKQDDLDDTVRDHVYDITVNGLDDLETQLSEDFEKWSNQLSSDLAKMSDAISNTISGAGENYSDMMAGIDYILNNIGGITSGQYFTSQDKSNMKKSNSFDTGYNSGHLKGYAKGTKHVGGVPRVAMTNENGREIIVTKKGILTPVEPSDGIIPNDMTETLMKMAERQQNYAMNSNFKMPELKVKDASGNSVNNVYNTFTVQGDLTRDTLPELNKILDLASSKTQNDIRKNKRRFG